MRQHYIFIVTPCVLFPFLCKKKKAAGKWIIEGGWSGENECGMMMCVCKREKKTKILNTARRDRRIDSVLSPISPHVETKFLS